MKKIVYFFLVLFFMASCDSSDAQRKDIEAKETALMEKAKIGKADTTDVHSLLQHYESYATKFPDDTIGASYLFKAADFYRYLKRPKQSTELYARIYEQYPRINKRAYALFLNGFTHENELEDYKTAETLYRKFLDEYPNHAIAGDVQVTLENLGKTPEQVLDELLSKQAEQAAASTEVQK